MKQLTEIVNQIDKDKKTMEILPTGFSILDGKLEGGLLKKELIVLGGKTGGGKSMFAGNMFYNIARKGYKSAYFSLEISNQMIVSRMLGSESRLSPTRILIKTLDEHEQERRNEAKAELSVFEEFMYFYDDLYELEEITKEIRMNKYDFVVIDFLQNIMAKKTDEYERLSFIALSLQKLAKEANTCILALSQLSNQMARDKKNTDIVEYKGSGAIGHAADLAFFLEDNTIEGYATIRIRKNRRGFAGDAFSFKIEQPGGVIIESVI